VKRVDVEQAAKTLHEGGLVAMPTETVYGLGANAGDARAVAQIFAVKGRPTNHPLIVHVADVAALDAWAREVPPSARRLAELFMPGPLTLVLPKRSDVLSDVTGGLDSVGLRVPSHPVALALLRSFAALKGGRAGVAAPSANRFGSVSPTCAEHVEADLQGEDVALLDGGPCEVGVESTIVDCTRADGPRLLRLGGVPREDIEAALGGPVPLANRGEVRAPGTLASHYAPRARLVACAPEDVAESVAEAQRQGLRVGVWADVAPPGVEAFVQANVEPHLRARALYDVLRRLDASVDVIVVSLPKSAGVGEAIIDRLGRASAPR
jgi:L-threonylcarbamoyladenylate synthase